MKTEKDGAGKQDKTQEELYNEEWLKAEAGEAGKPEDKKPDNPEPEPENKPEDGAKPEGAQDGLPEKKDGEPEPQTPPKNPEHGNLQSIEKALKDTKAYATKIAQEKSALEKEIAELRAGRGSQEAVNKAKDDLDATLGKVTDEIYQDYPELKKVLDPVISVTKKLSSEMESLKKATEVSQKEREERDKREEAKREFETVIKPEIVKEIPDFDKFMAEHANDLMTWGEAQTEAIKTALFSSRSPRDIVWAITEYKKSLVSGDAEKAKAEQKRKAEAIKNASATLRGGGSKPPFQSQEKTSADDWEEAGKLLEKQGIK